MRCGKCCYDENQVNDVKFGSLCGTGVTDAVFMLRKVQGEYGVNQQELHACFVDL